MCHCSNAHHRPSCIIESSRLAVAHAQPFAHPRQQVRGAAHRLHAAGHRHSRVAAAIACAASITAFSPEPHTLLTVTAGTASDSPPRERGLPRRGLAETGRDHVAHEAFVDARRIDAGAAHGFADDERAELGRGEVLQRAEELAGGQPRGRQDDGRLDLARVASGSRAHRSDAVTSMRVTTPAPSTRSRRERMSAGRSSDLEPPLLALHRYGERRAAQFHHARAIDSGAHRASATQTRPSPCVSGARRSTDASATGITCCSGIINGTLSPALASGL